MRNQKRCQPAPKRRRCTKWQGTQTFEVVRRPRSEFCIRKSDELCFLWGGKQKTKKKKKHQRGEITKTKKKNTMKPSGKRANLELGPDIAARTWTSETISSCPQRSGAKRKKDHQGKGQIRYRRPPPTRCKIFDRASGKSVRKTKRGYKVHHQCFPDNQLGRG